MGTPVVDRPVAGAQATLPVVDSPEADGNTERTAPVNALRLVKPEVGTKAPPVRSAPSAPHWQFGAQIAIGMVALFVLVMLVVVAFFSIPSSVLFTVDTAIGLGIITLSLALSALLALAYRHSS